MAKREAKVKKFIGYIITNVDVIKDMTHDYLYPTRKKARGCGNNIFKVTVETRILKPTKEEAKRIKRNKGDC